MAGTRTALIIGATSDIGRAIARRYAREGYELLLTARNREWLDAEVTDLRERYGCTAHGRILDILDREKCSTLVRDLEDPPDVTICVVGFMPDQRETERNPELADRVMRTNFNAPALLLEAIAARMAKKGSGTIIGISSVAGDRGRASNYTYGSAKAGFTAFLSGLRNRLAGTGVRVITVKPGFVRTRMTEGIDLPRLLTVEPDFVACVVWKAHRKYREIVYVKGVWRLIMAVIRWIPEPLFKRMKL